MATYIFNGECPSGIKQTFIDTYKYQHTDTWYKYAGDTNWRKVSITGDISGSSSAPTTQIPTVTNVVALEIGSDVTYIGTGAFRYCSRLTSIVIPDSVTSIRLSAFRDCSRLTSVTIPDSVTSIGDYAFSGCSGLTSIVIPDSVTSIGYSAFYGCSGLTSVTIGKSMTRIGQYAFYGCSGLIIFEVSPENPAYKSVNGLLLSKNGKTLVAGVNLTSVTIPDSVTSIGDYAFFGCSSLTSVTIGTAVTSISYRAFYGCSGLTSIVIPDSVTSIGNGTFSDCSSLTSVVFKGKTLAEVQAMSNYSWNITDTSIITVI